MLNWTENTYTLFSKIILRWHVFAFITNYSFSLLEADVTINIKARQSQDIMFHSLGDVYRVECSCVYLWGWVCSSIYEHFAFLPFSQKEKNQLITMTIFENQIEIVKKAVFFHGSHFQLIHQNVFNLFIKMYDCKQKPSQLWLQHIRIKKQIPWDISSSKTLPERSCTLPLSLQDHRKNNPKSFDLLIRSLKSLTSKTKRQISSPYAWNHLNWPPHQLLLKMPLPHRRGRGLLGPY